MILKIRDANGNVQEVLVIRGEKGDAYILTEADKQEIASLVSAAMLAAQPISTHHTETWTFTLEDGSTVTKAVCVE